MENLQIDRRAISPQSAKRPRQADIVRQGICLQASLGTVGTIEYLKARGVSCAVITRVLSSGRLRGEDLDE